MTDPKVTRRRRMAAQQLDAANRSLHDAWVRLSVAEELLTGTGDLDPGGMPNIAGMRVKITRLIGQTHIVERRIQLKRAARGK